MSSGRKNKQAPETPGLNTAREFEDLLKKTGRADRYVLQLFVTGTSPRSTQAIAIIRALCEEFLPGRYDLEVIDIYQQPGMAVSEQVIAVPTLVKKKPMPLKRMVGDLSNREKVVVALNLMAPGKWKAA